MAGAASAGGAAPAGDAIDTDLGGLFPLIVATSRALTLRYPRKYGPFERVVQLAEETGEVAEQINIWAGVGLKREKHGDFVPQQLAAEISDVVRVAVGIAIEFDILGLLCNEIRERAARVTEDCGDSRPTESSISSSEVRPE